MGPRRCDVRPLAPVLHGLPALTVWSSTAKTVEQLEHPRKCIGGNVFSRPATSLERRDPSSRGLWALRRAPAPARQHGLPALTIWSARANTVENPENPRRCIGGNVFRRPATALERRDPICGGLWALCRAPAPARSLAAHVPVWMEPLRPNRHEFSKTLEVHWRTHYLTPRHGFRSPRTEL